MTGLARQNPIRRAAALAPGGRALVKLLAMLAATVLAVLGLGGCGLEVASAVLVAVAAWAAVLSCRTGSPGGLLGAWMLGGLGWGLGVNVRPLELEQVTLAWAGFNGLVALAGLRLATPAVSWMAECLAWLTTLGVLLLSLRLSQPQALEVQLIYGSLLAWGGWRADRVTLFLAGALLLAVAPLGALGGGASVSMLWAAGSLALMLTSSAAPARLKRPVESLAVGLSVLACLLAYLNGLGEPWDESWIRAFLTQPLCAATLYLWARTYLPEWRAHLGFAPLYLLYFTTGVHLFEPRWQPELLLLPLGALLVARSRPDFPIQAWTGMLLMFGPPLLAVVVSRPARHAAWCLALAAVLWLLGAVTARRDLVVGAALAITAVLAALLGAGLKVLLVYLAAPMSWEFLVTLTLAVLVLVGLFTLRS